MEEKIVFHCENVNLSYKAKQCLFNVNLDIYCLLYTSPSPRDRELSRMPSSA